MASAEQKRRPDRIGELYMTLPTNSAEPNAGAQGMSFKAAPAKKLSVHLVTGFLGAGKTTLISRWMAEKPVDERWAILVNEFGQIGIDQTAWAGDDVFIQEVAGGCICCLQNMPLQLALGKITSRGDIDRLIIEPTGLGHPTQIIEMLQEAHWQPYLSLAASVCVLDARMLNDARVREHETFIAQVAVADVLLFSKADVLSDAERITANEFAAELSPAKALVAFVEPESSRIEALSVAAKPPKQQRRSLLHAPVIAALSPRLDGVSAEQAAQAKLPPYHYHEPAQGHFIGGWILPASWCFCHDELLTELMSWRDAERVKGVFHTDKGWIFFNATALDLAIRSSEYRSDSRVEIISPIDLDWALRELRLLACLIAATA
ncbi:MAG: G3E family GTPase [Paraperlucidibaca sp.]|jgi:G3E family GTPase